jgi:flagellar basal body rod protein FlgG
MLRGMYSAACAMEAAARNQDIVAENLAHVVTPGYRRQGSLFEIDAQPNDLASATQSAPNARNPRGYTNFEGGPLQQSSNPLDLALAGNGFFVVEGPDGPLYTRNGGFERSADGNLQTRSGGYRLLGAGGPIQVPADAAQINIAADGGVYANGNQIGRVQVATFANPEAMRRVGSTLFTADDPQTPPPGTVRVFQGYREGSNVQPVQEMVTMMLGMRYYQAAEKALSALSDAVAQDTRSQQ